MSILVKPYVISVWDDVWEDGQFVEKRLGIIGSDKMVAQCRALQPNLTRNVNGSKKLSFQMYHKYIDTMTGEEVINPFSQWMISERKVKLFYEDKWYDFVIKNIVENSSTYLYTYQLEDAIVMELSKNGFGTTLDAQLQNNMGSAKKLADFVLKETDWTVESEKFVERIEEHLVYATITKADLPEDAIIYKLLDSDESIANNFSGENNASLRTKGVVEENISNFFGNNSSKTILAFYSSCKNKPFHFQFIYLNDYAKDKVKIDETNRIIQETDCQYFIEFWPDEYKTEDNEGFIMPEGITTLVKTSSSDSDGTISIWYKGNRYGYAQQAEYSPKLNRYINLYKKDEKDYYGYVDNEYVSPTIIKNLVSNTQFKSTSGWIGASTSGESDDKAIIENVYGRFQGGTFISSMDDLKNGITNQYDNYVSYMRITLPTNNSIIFNDGIYNNRKSIENMEVNTKWVFRVHIKDTKGDDITTLPTFTFGEYDYSDGKYSINTSSSFAFKGGTILTNNTYAIYTVDKGYSTKEAFIESSHIRIAITGPGTYYIKEMEFFPARYNGTNLITPDSQDGTISEGVVVPTYYYFSKENYNKATSLENLEDIDKFNAPIKTYKPVFNEGAEKIRSVTVKESNHFNNLQSIAETFDCWTDFDITRAERGDQEGYEEGAIKSKKVILKNYAGNNNFACFRYGVNLKDIQRTYESKNITTKLIVKQNNNELGEDGFCTIQRAGANPTGENYIYDFQYYQNIGLMSAEQYIDVLYKMSHNSSSAIGPDITNEDVTDESNCNIQGYFPRLRNLNKKIIDENKLLIGIVSDLREKNAQLKVAETALSAAKEGVAEVSEDFLKLTQFYPWEIGSKEITKVSLCGVTAESEVMNFITSLDEYAYNTKEEAKTKNGFYCSHYAELDLEGSIPSNQNTNLVGLRINNKNLLFGARWKDPNIINKKTVEIYFYPKFYFGNEDTSGTTREVIITLDFTKDLFVTEKQTINGEEKEYKYSYCVRSKQFLLISENNENIDKYFVQYSTYKQEENEQTSLVSTLKSQVNSLTTQQNTYKNNIDRWTKQKTLLNKTFYQVYSRFIQEGTWIGEEYVDDDKYYADALSVIYNSCYPQVAYSVNVTTLGSLPGYEDLVFEVGDKTYVIDPEFFGDKRQAEVVITEMTNVLDDPTADTIRVQNFKNQFQDLFQRITATSQQVQYNAGSYESGSALAREISENSVEFLTNSLEQMAMVDLSNPDLESVSVDGSSAIKIVDGKILLGKKKEDGTNEWTTGLSSAGISANKITAGQIDTSLIQIMSGTEPAFRWDAFGISAFANEEFEGVISGTDTNKFVRFDKYGLYGINGGVDGLSWHAEDEQDIDKKATFSLTWEGLKVTNNNKVSLRIGDGAKNNGGDTDLLNIKDSEGDTVFAIAEDGSIQWSSGSTSVKVLYTSDVGQNTPDKEVWQSAPETDTSNDGSWHTQKSENDKFMSQSYDGGNTWSDKIPLGAKEIKQQICFFADGTERYPETIQDENGQEKDNPNAGKIDFTETYNRKLSDYWYPIGGTDNAATEPPEIVLSQRWKTTEDGTNWVSFAIKEGIEDPKTDELVEYWSDWYEADNVTNYRIYKLTKIEYTDGNIIVYSEENTTAAVYQKNALLAMLDDEDTADGIYNDHGQIAIKANAIKAGALSVGSTPYFDGNGNIINNNDNIIYADFDNKQLCLAGWKVTGNSIQKETIGAEGSYILSSTGQSGTINNIQSQWALAIGKNFGITKDGEMYCFGGSININNRFIVDNDGNVKMLGSIDFGDENSITTLTIYNKTKASLPTGDQWWEEVPDNYNENTLDGWHKVYNSNTSKYICQSYDNGANWTDVKPYGAAIDKDDIVRALETTASENGDGIWNEGGRIAINASLIRAGYIQFKDVYGNGTSYFIDPFLQKTGNTNTYIDLPGFKLTTTSGRFGCLSTGSGRLWDSITEETYLIANPNSFTPFYIRSNGVCGQYYEEKFVGFEKVHLVARDSNSLTQIDPGKILTKHELTIQFMNDSGIIDKTLNLSNLVFKGPYNIIYSGRVVGKICQSGPVVYGYFQPGDKTNKLPATETTLYVQDVSGSSKTLPGPYTTVSTIWHGDNSGNDYGVSGVDFEKNGSGNLEITANAFVEDTWKGSIYRGNTYFCYSANNDYHWG